MIRILPALAWLLLVGWSLLGAPAEPPGLWDRLVELALFRGDPALVALFLLMGVWPLAWGALLARDGPGQPAPAWPFVVASFGLGAFALLPYLVLRRPGQPEASGRLAELGRSPWTWVVLGVLAGAPATWGLASGDLAILVEAFGQSRFVHVMTLDFLVLCVAFALVAGERTRDPAGPAKTQR